VSGTDVTPAATGLQFGTAGLRAPMGPGPGEMNSGTVRRASAGLAAFVNDQRGNRPASIVIGFDARHHSAEFAHDAAAVFAGAGVRGLLIAEPVPTPVLAFAVRELHCDAGVMITASHNPATDNGYKVYAADGAQIVPPVDSEISERIEAAPAAEALALGEPEPLRAPIVARYLDAVVPAALEHAPPEREVSIVYTPVHGVGRDVMLPALARGGFPTPRVVAEQSEPDPEFPTAPRPNPEEPGVLDLARRDARTAGADLVLANDPDADRLAVAVPWPDAEGDWRALTGDEVGSLLGDELLRAVADPADALLIASVVSGTMLAEQAKAAGAQYAQTLTGFKWIMHVAERSPARLLLGYEQALGYGVTELVRDKDGISAALVMAAIAARARAEGTTVKARLDTLAERFGLHATVQRSLDLSGADAADRVQSELARLRDRPPSELIGEPVTAVDDLSTGERRDRTGATTSLGLPPSSGIIVHAGDAVRLAVRPSGTEPKLKLYLQVVLGVESGDADGARDRVAPLLDALAREAEELIAR
jgi:phosphomannomutase